MAQDKMTDIYICNNCGAKECRREKPHDAEITNQEWLNGACCRTFYQKDFKYSHSEKIMAQNNSALKNREPHPSCTSVALYLHNIDIEKLLAYQESFASCAIEGNRLAEICFGTIDRLLRKESISDRYLLGLAWAIRDMEEKDNGAE